MAKNTTKAIFFPLSYSVVGATSEDEDYPLYTLSSVEKNNNGWCSSKFCQYPQEIILKLDNPAKLLQINLTFHECKIPSKIDFYYFYPDKKKDKNNEKQYTINNLPFIKLGYIVPNSNEKTNYKSREFQKIKINQKVLYLKFVLYKNYINLENTYNQVSIVSIELFGFEMENDLNFDIDINKNGLELSTQKYKDEELDKECLNKLKEIKYNLDLCIKNEKYGKAKIFRELYQRVRLLGEKINNLFDFKLKCIEINDFEGCKKLQGEIDRIKNLINNINTNIPEKDESANSSFV